MNNDGAGESHSLRGSTDRGALIDFRDVFNRQEPLADGELDDFFDPDELRITLSDGVGAAESAHLDIVWTTENDYNIHYADTQEKNLRWDVHPNDFPHPPGEKHFHPPPDASSDANVVEDSCIAVPDVVLVARAAHKLWRYAYDQESFESINDVSNSP